MTVNPIVVTFDTDIRLPGVQRLKKSLEKWNWTYVILEYPLWRGFGFKLKSIVTAAKQIRDNQGFSHLISIDARDCIATGPPSEFEAPAVPLLLATERNCWPRSELSSHFKDVGHPFKFAHSPFTVDLNKLDLLEVDNLPDYYDDQLHVTELYIKGKREEIDLDYDCKILQSNAFCLPNWQEHFDIVGDRLINKYTGSKPLFQHCNGGTETEWWKPLL